MTRDIGLDSLQLWKRGHVRVAKHVRFSQCDNLTVRLHRTTRKNKLEINDIWKCRVSELEHFKRRVPQHTAMPHPEFLASKVTNQAPDITKASTQPRPQKLVIVMSCPQSVADIKICHLAVGTQGEGHHFARNRTWCRLNVPSNNFIPLLVQDKRMKQGRILNKHTAAESTSRTIPSLGYCPRKDDMLVDKLEYQRQDGRVKQTNRHCTSGLLYPDVAEPAVFLISVQLHFVHFSRQTRAL
jgi:hypothetical protein